LLFGFILASWFNQIDIKIPIKCFGQWQWSYCRVLFQFWSMSTMFLALILALHRLSKGKAFVSVKNFHIICSFFFISAANLNVCLEQLLKTYCASHVFST
jgi:hypothetical protein